MILPDPARGGSCCCHVSQVRSSVSSRLALSGVLLRSWALVPQTVTPLPCSTKIPLIIPFKPPLSSNPKYLVTCQVYCGGGLVFASHLKKCTSTAVIRHSTCHDHLDPLSANYGIKITGWAHFNGEVCQISGIRIRQSAPRIRSPVQVGFKSRQPYESAPHVSLQPLLSKLF